MERTIAMNKTVIQTKDLCKTYIVEKQSNNVLQNVNLNVEEGEFVSIMGPSGSGKSTLLYTVSGMDRATAGEVIFDGENISGKNEKEMSYIRLTKMGFIFQQMYMMKKLCIMDNIVLPGYQAKLKSREKVNEEAEKLMRRLITATLCIPMPRVRLLAATALSRLCFLRFSITSKALSALVQIVWLL